MKHNAQETEPGCGSFGRAVAHQPEGRCLIHSASPSVLGQDTEPQIEKSAFHSEQ